MASTFSPRSRGDREFVKFGLDGTAGDANPVGLSVGGYTSTTIFKNLLVAADGTLQTSASVTASNVSGSVRIGDGANSFASITGGKLDVNATVTTTALSSVVDSVKIVDGGGSITVDGTFYQATQPVSATALDIRALSNAVDSVRITDGGGSITVDGTFYQATQPVSATALDIRALSDVVDSVRITDGGGSITVDGTFWQTTQPVSATLFDTRRLSNVEDSIRVSGDIAHDSADSGSPIKVGGKAYEQDGTAPGTAVAELDRANFITDRYGRQFVSADHPVGASANGSYSALQTDTQLVAAPGSGLSIYLKDLLISCGGTANTIVIKDGNAGGVAATRIPSLAFTTYGGATSNFQQPIRFVANSSMSISSSVAGSFSALVNYYIAP